MKALDKVLAAIFTISILLITARWALFAWITSRFNIDLRHAAAIGIEASALGIIGGADGPTAIFVSSASNIFSAVGTASFYAPYTAALSAILLIMRKILSGRRP